MSEDVRWVLRDPGEYGSRYTHAYDGGAYSRCNLSLTPGAPLAPAGAEPCPHCVIGESYPPCN